MYEEKGEKNDKLLRMKYYNSRMKEREMIVNDKLNKRFRLLEFVKHKLAASTQHGG